MLPSFVRYRTEEIDRADSRFDELWQRASWELVIGERTSDYLNWRYAKFKSESYRFFCLVELATGRVAGYLVYRLEDKKAVVVDLFAQAFGELLDYVLLHFAMRMRRARLDSIYLSYFGTPAFARRLEALHFFERPLKRPVIINIGPAVPEARA